MGYPIDLQDIPGASYGPLGPQKDLEMIPSTSTEAGQWGLVGTKRA